MSSVLAAQKDYPLQQNPLSDVQLAQSPTRQSPPDHVLSQHNTDDAIDGRTSDPDRMFDSALSGDDNANPAALIPSHQLHHSIIINGDENSPPHINDPSSSSSSSSSSSLDQSPPNHIPSNSMVSISGNMQPTSQAQGLSDDQPYSEEEPNNETTESHELKRVKVYELIGARWVDQGTAFCFGDFQDSEALLVARAEADFNHIILTTTIRSTDVYQRQQGSFSPSRSIQKLVEHYNSYPFSSRSTETLIVWTEPDGVDYALSFQDPEGCAEVWNFIQEVQRHMNATGTLPFLPSAYNKHTNGIKHSPRVSAPPPSHPLFTLRRSRPVFFTRPRRFRNHDRQYHPFRPSSHTYFGHHGRDRKGY